MTIDRSSPPAPGPIRAYEFPRVERRALDNGLVVLSAHSGDLPLVTVRAVIDAGTSAEREGEAGLAWLTAHALEGGTAARTGEELAWALERLGAQLDVWTSWDAVSVALTVRSDALADGVDLLAEIVRRPSFPEREVERLRGEQVAEMMTRSTEPRALADDSAARWIFADGATYGRTLLGDEATVGSFTVAECRSFHDRRFSPHGSAVIVVGAVTADRAEREVRRAFGDWTGAQEQVPAPSTAPRHDRTTIHVIDRASAVQSELRIGHVGVPRHHHDYYALLVMNAIAGGAFTSRLNLNLREKHGFTYGVRSSFAFRRAAGPFVIQTAVASDVTARAVAETLKELRALQESVDVDEEVRNARDFIAGTLPLQLQTTDQLAARVADLHTYGLPDDHLENYGEQVRAVSSEDVLRVAREHLLLDQLAVVVVGNAAAVIDDLRSLGIGDVVHHNGGIGQGTEAGTDVAAS